MACRSCPYETDELLCIMCWTSPYQVNKRRLKMLTSDPTLDGTEKLAIRSDGGGLRYDEGKSRVDLIPSDALMVLGEVYAAGAKKYAPRNWERGMPWSKVLGPLLRHLYKWMSGAKIDEETGQLHIAMVVWNAMALLTYELRAIGTDDRKSS